jgi:SAM-dependent methyltransferase
MARIEQGSPAVAPGNEEAKEAWSGVLFDVFVKFRPLVVGGLGAHGETALDCAPPSPGDRALDIGCGFGDTTRRIAELVGDGSAHGVDVSEPFVETARREAEAAGAANVSFAVCDVQSADLGGPYDYVFSRMGMMFFANPVAALRNVRSSLRPGGRLCAVVWRRKLDNDWLHRTERVVERYLDHPEETDQPTCGPGPFSMADADTLTEQLTIAGFEEIGLRRCDLPIKLGADLDEAVDFNMALGPGAEVLRLWGDRAGDIRPTISREIREALTDFEGPDGVWGPGSTWIVTATAPAG